MNHFSVQLDNFLPEDNSGSLIFEGLTEVIICHRLEEVLLSLDRIEAAVRSGLHAAGFVSYEAAQAMDPLLQSNAPGNLPLLCFGLFQNKYHDKQQQYADQSFTISNLQAEISRREFEQAIAKIHRYIAAGDTYQVNYTYRMNGKFVGDARSFYRQISHNQRAAYNALIEFEQFVIASASPELFFRWKNGALTTKPMKGTAPRGLDLAGDAANSCYLQNSPKEKAENVMIVDLLRNDMNRIAAPGSVQVEKLFEVEKYETLLQMTSTIHADLPPQTAFADIFRALFPCGSITGAPKIRTMEIIKNLECSPRGIYTGCIGYFSPGPEAVFNVPFARLSSIDIWTRYKSVWVPALPSALMRARNLRNVN